MDVYDSVQVVSIMLLFMEDVVHLGVVIFCFVSIRTSGMVCLTMLSTRALCATGMAFAFVWSIASRQDVDMSPLLEGVL